jgi:hypothetical protein
MNWHFNEEGGATMQREQQSSITPTDIILVLNRSYRTMQESSRCETRDAAEKAFYNCHNWLRARRTRFHQDPTGEWILDENVTDAQ